MQKKEQNPQVFARRLAAQMERAMERLRALGARMVKDNGRQMMYVPGDVCLRAAFSVEMYGETVATRKRRHKRHLRRNSLGKFRKGK